MNPRRRSSCPTRSRNGTCASLSRAWPSPNSERCAGGSTSFPRAVSSGPSERQPICPKESTAPANGSRTPNLGSKIHWPALPPSSPEPAEKGRAMKSTQPCVALGPARGVFECAKRKTIRSHRETLSPNHTAGHSPARAFDSRGSRLSATQLRKFRSNPPRPWIENPAPFARLLSHPCAPIAAVSQGRQPSLHASSASPSMLYWKHPDPGGGPMAASAGPHQAARRCPRKSHSSCATRIGDFLSQCCRRVRVFPKEPA